jgi:hypothetical protein
LFRTSQRFNPLQLMLISQNSGAFLEKGKGADLVGGVYGARVDAFGRDVGTIQDDSKR